MRAVSAAVCDTGLKPSPLVCFGCALAISYLLETCTGSAQFILWGFLSFLNEGMQNDDTLAHGRAVEYAPDAFSAPGAQFKQPVTHRARMRHAQVRAEVPH